MGFFLFGLLPSFEQAHNKELKEDTQTRVGKSAKGKSYLEENGSRGSTTISDTIMRA